MDLNSDLYLNKIPPQNLEAEESVISSILLDSEAIVEIINFIKPQDFYKKSNQQIYKSAISLFQKNEPIDLVTLSNKMKEDGKLEEVGGATYLAQIVDSVPQAANVKHYATIIKNKAILRSMIEASAIITEKCFDGSGDTNQIIGFAENSILKVSDQRIINKKPQSFKESMLRVAEKISERYDSDQTVFGLETGFGKFDEITGGLQPSDLIILAARPSMGKTSLALNIVSNVASKGSKTLLFSLEMDRDSLIEREMATRTRLDSMKFKKGIFNKEEWERVEEQFENPDFENIICDDQNSDIDSICSIARKEKKENNIRLIVIDYIQIMDMPKADRRDISIGLISQRLKKLAKELKIPIIALSQLNRMLEQRNDKRPILSDLKESGSLEQDADLVVFIYRDEVYDKNTTDMGIAEILLKKHRNGSTGRFKLSFDGRFTLFSNLEGKWNI